ncbi:TM0106 family RecB-like putative nuclease [Dankookia sp. GCM10030260]|uniref:TM0106 family RecB-like putative nuclease n=1 Tax=Dankookia sp. GCM10030260 TaxID=3273390 RepID=UPI00360B5F89
MRHYHGRLLLSAGDLNAFLGCRHASALARRVLDGETIKKGAADATLELVQGRGLAHEAAYRKALEAEGRLVLEIAGAQSLEDRIAATTAAMRQGADVIFQGALARGRWHGFADFLVRVEQPSSLGPWCYEVVDTKLASRAKASHAIQLALYADLVEAVQGVPPPALRVKLGNGREEVIRPGDVVHYARLAGRRLEDFMAAAVRETEAEPCGHCAICDWSERCEAEWEQADHLSRVANIRGGQVRRLRAAGVDTMAELAALPEGQRIPDIAPATLATLRAQALLQHQARVSGGKVYEILSPEPGRGFGRLPPPDAGDVYFDMEGDPLFPEGGLEYLFGMEAGGHFRGFWAHDRAQEKRAFEAFMDVLAAQLAARPGAHVYHYNHYETTALKRLAMRHGTREAALDDMLRRRRFVDLYVVVREQLRIGEPRYSLKNVEHFFRDARAGEVETAADSIVAYERFCETGDTNILSEIEAYNKIDCRSTAELHGWLLGLRPVGAPWFDPAVEAPDAAKEEKQRAAEAEREALRSLLLSGATAEETPYRALVAELCNFHRREQKPQWWAMFDRMERDEEELIADAECLGGLVAEGPCGAEKKSFLRAYCYPPQDTKLRLGEKPTIAATMERAGEIVTLDEAACRLVLKRGKAAGELPEALCLGPAPPIEDAVLRAAMRRFAGSVAARDGRFAALEGILRREPPRIAGQIAGAPILAAGETALAGAIRTVSALDRSYLFIQGPPGTGKTWTTSRIAVALMQAGRRVGVASLSHKAINNLLEGIEAAAREQGFAFTGIKKATAGKPEQAFEGDCITTVTDNDDVPDDCDLVAGTAWLFAREEQELGLDTLFVDEAGQVSLGNLVAMGLATRNIVLVGDQQQLGQPIQGAHPEGTGVSALEHLLQGAATVPPDRGILLDVSFRMHPALCDWVSEAIYEGRLRAHPDAGRQRLVLADGAPTPLGPHGLRFHVVTHAGRSQSCPEEVAEAAQLWRALVGQRWVDRHGKERAMTAEDVLVVAPYNVQVNLLRRSLPEGARVGTVDRFQGQEAPVVLVSMTTSSGDDLPRDIAFLFSRNRLNVAVSRAKCLAVLLASPQLLEVECGKVDELALVNTLCSAFAWQDTARAVSDWSGL